MIKLLLILFVIGLAVKYKEWILGLVGIAIIIFVGAKFFDALLSYWRIILIVIGVLVAISILYLVCQKKKYRLQLNWLDQRGVEQVPNVQGDAKFWKTMEEMGFVKQLPSGHVISSSFYSSITKKIEQKGIFTQSVLRQLCRQSAHKFQDVYLTSLIAFLEEKSKLFPLYLQLGDVGYLSPNVVTECETLFAKEGAATRSEFAQVCSNVVDLYGYSGENRTLSDFIIDRLLSRQIIHEIELQERSDFLYVAKHQRSDSKMTKREISLDD